MIQYVPGLGLSDYTSFIKIDGTWTLHLDIKFELHFWTQSLPQFQGNMNQCQRFFFLFFICTRVTQLFESWFKIWKLLALRDVFLSGLNSKKCEIISRKIPSINYLPSIHTFDFTVYLIADVKCSIWWKWI